MNTCALAGRLVRNAVLKGTDKKVMLFTVATRCGFDEHEQKERVTQVPCIVFSPTPELETALVEHGEGTYIELEGRVISSSFETKGERRVSTEVMAFPRSIAIVSNGKS